MIPKARHEDLEEEDHCGKTAVPVDESWLDRWTLMMTRTMLTEGQVPRGQVVWNFAEGREAQARKGPVRESQRPPAPRGPLFLLLLLLFLLL